MLRAVILSVSVPSSTTRFVCQGYEELDKIHQVMYLHYITCGRALYRQTRKSSRLHSVRMTKFFEKILKSIPIKLDFSSIWRKNENSFWLLALPLLQDELKKPQTHYVTSDNFYPFEVLEFTPLFIWQFIRKSKLHCAEICTESIENVCVTQI